jgi:hypothetical protein
MPDPRERHREHRNREGRWRHHGRRQCLPHGGRACGA